MSSPITNLKVQSIDHPGPVQEIGWIFETVDLNAGAGGKYQYVGSQREAGSPVTSLNFFASKTKQDNPEIGYDHWDKTDLNMGVGGDYIYMEWNTGESGKAPITDIKFIATDRSTPPNESGWIQTGVDLNKGAGGKYIWAYYKTA